MFVLLSSSRLATGLGWFFLRKHWPALHRCKRFAWAILLLLPFAEGQANVLVLQQADEPYKLDEYLEILAEAGATDASLSEVMASPFIPMANTLGPFPSHREQWIRFQLRNDLSDALQRAEWVLHFSLILTDVRYFAVGENGMVQEGRSGFFVPVQERTFLPAVKGNFGKITLRPGELVTVYVQARSDRVDMGPQFDISLSHSSLFFEKLKGNKLRNGIFVGFILLILTYNLFLFFLAKDRALIYYSVYLFGLVTFTVYNTGDLADWLTLFFFQQHPQHIVYFKTITYFAIIAYLNFLRHFLDLRNLLPKVDRVFRWLILAAGPFFVLDVAATTVSNFNYSYPDVFTIGYSLIFLAVAFGFLIPLSKTADKKRYFIIGGTMAMGLGILTIVILRFQTADYSTLYFRIGIVLEVIIFSMGLAYRFREAELQKQQASFELEKARMRQQQREQEAQQLQELNQLKTRLYTNVTHEFRTPLTVIIGNLEMMKLEIEQALAKIPVSQFLISQISIAKRNSDNLLRLINQLLNLSKLESGTMKLDLVNGDIISYLQYLTESFYSLAEEKGVRLTFYPEGRSLDMDYDEDKMQHIVFNLLSNALKFTDEGGKVVLHARQIEQENGSWLQLKVSDTGIGIKEADRERIFDRFYQADSPHAQAGAGTGIGLALTKELVELLGGQISVESDLGSGSDFVVLLPVRNEVTEKPSVQELPKEKTALQASPPKEVPVATPKDQSDERPLVLIIEDNWDVITYIQQVLENDYAIDMAMNGQMGIERALETVPDLIISDVMMPLKNGYEVCQTLKNDERTSHIPIILLTAKAAAEDRLEGLRGGADAFLTKPFNKEELLIRVKKLVELRQSLRQRYADLTHPAQTDSLPEPLESAFLQKLRGAVEGNLKNSDFGVSDLCQAMFLSNMQVNRKLKALMDMTPSKFIRSVRLQRAVKLLNETDLNISEIAFEVGFNDPNYFTRVYSETFGHPPSELRN